jgi:hypothetical protein
VPIAGRAIERPSPIQPIVVAGTSRFSPVVRFLLAGTGLFGLVLAAIGVVMLTSLEPAGLATAVDRTLVAAERSATDAATAVDGAASAGGAAANVARQLGEASVRAGRSLDVGLFGLRPLAPAVVEFERLGTESRELAAELDVATTRSSAAADDLRDLAPELATLTALGRSAGEALDAGNWRWFVVGAVALATMVLLVGGLGIPMLADAAPIAGVIALLTIASIGIGLLLAAISDSERQAVQRTLLVLLASIFFSGLVLPLTDFVPAVQALGHALPVSHGMRLLQDLMLSGRTTALWQVAALGGICLVTLGGAWILLRRRMARI